MKVSLDQEKATLSIEQSKLLKDKQKLEQDKTKLNHDQQALLTLEQNLKLQTLQVNRTSEIAQEVHKEGQQALTIAHRIQEDLNRKVIKLQKKEEILSTQVMMIIIIIIIIIIIKCKPQYKEDSSIKMR